MKVSIVYWSGTGNTEAMANAVAEGAKNAGAEVELLPVSAASADILSSDALLFGCPAMGAEELEESEFEPFFSSVEGSLEDGLICNNAPDDDALAACRALGEKAAK